MTPSSPSLGNVAFTRPLARQPSLWSCDRFLHAIAGLNPFRNGGNADAINRARRRPVWVVDPSYSDRAQIPFVFGKIFQSRHPSAVGRFIPKIWVYAVNLVFSGRTLPHVLQKGHERFIPPIADANPSTAVFREVFESRIFAAPLHTNPYTVSGASFAANFMAVLQSSVRVSHGHLDSIRPLKGKQYLGKMKALVS